MIATQSTPSLQRLSFGIGTRFADIILFTQLLSIISNLLWYFEINTNDWVGFINVSGDIANLSAYFGFTFFGILFCIFSPHRFWQTLHPLTLGIALLFLPLYLLPHHLSNINVYLLLIAFTIGCLLPKWTKHVFKTYPRSGILIFMLCLVGARYAIPWPSIPYLYMIYICSGFLIVMPIVHRHSQKHATLENGLQNINEKEKQ